VAWSSIVLAVAPGVVWLWVFYRKDDHEPEPLGALFGAFALGAVAVGLVLLVRPYLETCSLAETPWTAALLDSFALTAPLEEAAKFLALLIGVSIWREFDEPLDGVIYGIAVGLGFASAENLLFGAGGVSSVVLLQRGLTSTLGHVAFSGSLGYFLGHAWFARGGARFGWGMAGFGSAVLLHGLYDFLLFAPGGLGTLALLGVLPLGLALLGWKIRHHRSRSPEFHA
jgi:RsiW-degrading membrane proteinase PrsW (M82 family)